MKDAHKVSLVNTPEGVVITVKAVPGASRNKIVGALDKALKIAVSAPAEKGKANTAIAKTLAKALNLPAKSVTLVQGQTNPRKQFLIAGCDANFVRNRLHTL